jgi:integrase/recombinase XerD
MNTPKIILYKHKTYTDGTHPVIFQVIKNGKPIRKVLGRCLPVNWLSSKNRVSSKDINSYRINEAIENALKSYGVTKKYTFQQLFQQQVDDLFNNQQVSRYNINKSVLSQITTFRPDVDFEDITESFIIKFCAWLRESPRKNNPNTIREKMQVIGKILKIAKKAKVIPENILEDMAFPKEKAIKTKLSLEEMKTWINSDFDGNLEEVRDFITAMIYLRGIRIGDALTLSTKNIIDGRIIYREHKTGKVHDIGITPELQLIINKWKGKNKHGYIFTFMELPQKSLKDKFLLAKFISKARSQVTRYLKIMAKLLNISKNVTPHTIRHSFSKLANSVIKNTTITKDLVGHSTLSVHEGYISDISDDDELDGHAKSVLDKLK